MSTINTLPYSRKQSRNVTSKKYDLCDYYDEMIKKCEQRIKVMLNDLVLIYKEYKVRFSVFQLQDSLIRMLIPIQFRTVTDNSEILFYLESKEDAYDLLNAVHSKAYTLNGPILEEPMGDKRQRLNTQPRSEAAANKDKKSILYQNQIPRIPQEKSKNKLLFQSNQTSAEERVQNSEQQQRSQVKLQDYETNYNYLSRRPIRKPGVRSRGLQNYLCEWIFKEYRKGYLVSRADVITKAKQIGKDSNLKGSAGWYSNFIRRNPEIRRILSKGNQQRKRSGFSKDGQDIQAEGLGQMSNEFNEMRNGIYDEEDDDEIETEGRIKGSPDENSFMDYENSAAEQSSKYSEEKKESS